MDLKSNLTGVTYPQDKSMTIASLDYLVISVIVMAHRVYSYVGLQIAFIDWQLA